jgi:acyl-CoA hydrolase
MTEYFFTEVPVPQLSVTELAKQAHRLRNVEVVSITVQGEIEIAKPQYKDSFYINSLFVSAPVREAVNSDRGDYVPVFLSEIPLLFKNNILPLDVAIVQVSPPDQHGYCTLGTSIDVARSAVDSAKLIIAQVNPKMPRTFGDSMIHVERIAKMVWHETELLTIDYSAKVTADETKIGQYIADLIDDKSTLQMGVGTIPDAVLNSLHNHKDLGIHTEMISDGAVDLIKKDIINNKFKGVNNNKTITAFCFGTKKLYDYIDNNPSFAFMEVTYVNNPMVIAQNKKLIAINSAIEVDLTGKFVQILLALINILELAGKWTLYVEQRFLKAENLLLHLPPEPKRNPKNCTSSKRRSWRSYYQRTHSLCGDRIWRCLSLWQKHETKAQALIEIAHPDDREMLDRFCFERFKAHYQ